MSLYFDAETILNGSSAGKIKQLTGIRFLDGATLCLSGNVSFGHEIEIKGRCSLKDGTSWIWRRVIQCRSSEIISETFNGNGVGSDTFWSVSSEIAAKSTTVYSRCVR